MLLEKSKSEIKAGIERKENIIKSLHDKPQQFKIILKFGYYVLLPNGKLKQEEKVQKPLVNNEGLLYKSCGCIGLLRRDSFNFNTGVVLAMAF